LRVFKSGHAVARSGPRLPDLISEISDLFRAVSRPAESFLRRRFDINSPKKVSKCLKKPCQVPEKACQVLKKACQMPEKACHAG
jgi:hypothetical protein